MGFYVRLAVLALSGLAFGCGRPTETPTQLSGGPNPNLVALYPNVPKVPRWAEPTTAETGALAQQALAPDADIAAPAIAELRRRGPSGLDALLAADDGSDRARHAIEAVAQQRDARASRLFWYTDLEEAKQAATAAHKPILSLRLLGQLDEELSCANSRFFRTALYANEQVSAYLRSRFILHWSSERPAPRITVDFGDGRRMERTITGNSIHYVLDGRGAVVDAIPGLYGPGAFVGVLENAARLDVFGDAVDTSRRRQALSDFHRQRLDTIAQAWTADLAYLGVSARPPESANAPSLPAGNPSAAQAVPIALPKAVVEAPLVEALVPSQPNQPTPLVQLAAMTHDGLWVGMANRRASAATLDAASQRLMKKKSGVDAPTLARQVASFEKLMALDTVKNEYTLHRQIHEWMIAGAVDDDWVKLNARVYSELFLTPQRDPWVGLVTPDTYTGIENEGLTTP